MCGQSRETSKLKIPSAWVTFKGRYTDSFPSAQREQACVTLAQENPAESKTNETNGGMGDPAEERGEGQGALPPTLVWAVRSCWRPGYLALWDVAAASPTPLPNFHSLISEQLSPGSATETARKHSHGAYPSQPPLENSKIKQGHLILITIPIWKPSGTPDCRELLPQDRCDRVSNSQGWARCCGPESSDSFLLNLSRELFRTKLEEISWCSWNLSFHRKFCLNIKLLSTGPPV